MNIEEWKNLDDEERQSIVQNIDDFNPYSDEAYELVRSLGKELARKESLLEEKVGVLNRFGELIIHLHVPDNVEHSNLKNQDARYYNFKVFYSPESKWFEH